MKRQRLDRAINARIINFPDANNHLTGLLTEYLTRSLGLPGDPPGTNTVIGLLKSGLGDLIVLAGLKEWLQEQVDAGILEAANQAQFNQWVKDHIGQTEQDIDTIDSTLDTINRWVDRASKVISIIAKAVKAIKDILSIFGFIEIPQGTTPQYDYNSNFDPDDPDELEEFVNALIEILSNGWLKPKFYTKAEITALLNDYLTQSAASTNYYTKIQVDAYLTTLATQKANSSDVYTKSETNTLLAAKADVSNTYTKTETDTLLNAKANSSIVYTKTEVDTTITGLYNFFFPIGSYFLFHRKISLSNGSSGHATSSGTILDYFTWEFIDSGVLGSQGYNSVQTTATDAGNWNIQVSDLPPHSHKGITGYHAYNGNTSSYYPPADAQGWGGGNVSRSELFLKNTIGIESNNVYTENLGQTSFIPRGHYLFCYVRTA